MYVLLGRNVAESKQNLVRWLDEIVLTRTATDPRTIDLSGNRIPGRYSGIKQREYMQIEQALSSVDQWTAQCVQQHLSCGNYLVNLGTGRGKSSEVCILMGPFQKTS